VSALSWSAMLIPQQRGKWGPSPARPHEPVAGMLSDFSGAYIGTAWQWLGGYLAEGSYYRDNGIEAPFGRAGRTTLVEVESVFLANGITTLFKRLVGRCRPRAWRDGHCAGEEFKAFPSGHTAPVAAIAGARGVMVLRSDGVSGARAASFAFAEGATVLTAVLRVLAGAHSWEDVVGGMAIGHATGSLVSLAHPMEQLGGRDPGLPPGPPPAAASFVYAGAF
jgi:membrane-associated phospholipid phosphatase